MQKNKQKDQKETKVKINPAKLLKVKGPQFTAVCLRG